MIGAMDDFESSRRLHPTSRRRPAPPTGVRVVGVAGPTDAGPQVPPGGRRLCISCDDCAMQATVACGDCVVSFVLRDDPQVDTGEGELVLDADEVRVVGLLAKAGLVPELRYRLAG
jgi:hypothetical protein